MTDSDFAGKVALITGGANGIGRSTARHLRERGGAVAVFDAAAAQDPVEIAFVGDVSVSADVNRAVAETAQQLGRIDILICCAGITGDLCHPLKLSDAQFDRVMSVNANGVFYSMRAALPMMVERGYGRVVNLASLSAKEGLPNADAYAASKAAVVSLTRTVARSVAGSGVLINCVAPTVIRTEMIDALSDEYKESALSRIPLGRFGETEELAQFLAYLASPQLTFSTGMCFDFSGGRANF